MEQVQDGGIKPQIMDESKKCLESMNKIIEKDPKLFSLIKKLENFDPTLFTHSVIPGCSPGIA